MKKELVDLAYEKAFQRIVNPAGFHAERYIVEQCIGCNRVTESLCSVYPNPGAWFRHPGKYCPMASHIHSTSSAPKGKVRVGQQKQKKSR